jgi:Holliday junction resolvase
MVNSRKKGYRVERNIRIMFECAGWKVVRSGASLGESDLIAFKNGTCLMLQIKSTAKKKFYYGEYMERMLEGFEFYLIVDFGYGKIRIMHPQPIVSAGDGEDLKTFLSMSR